MTHSEEYHEAMAATKALIENEERVMTDFDFAPSNFAEKNGRRIGTRITLASSQGTYIAMELPIVQEQTVFWAAQSAKKALNMQFEGLMTWFIERYDAINCDGTAQYCGPEGNRCTH